MTANETINAGTGRCRTSDSRPNTVGKSYFDYTTCDAQDCKYDAGILLRK